MTIKENPPASKVAAKKDGDGEKKEGMSLTHCTDNCQSLTVKEKLTHAGSHAPFAAPVTRMPPLSCCCCSQ